MNTCPISLAFLSEHLSPLSIVAPVITPRFRLDKSPSRILLRASWFMSSVLVVGSCIAHITYLLTARNSCIVRCCAVSCAQDIAQIVYHVFFLAQSSHLSLFSTCDLIIPRQSFFLSSIIISCLLYYLFSACDLIRPYQSFLPPLSSFRVTCIIYSSSLSFPVIASFTPHFTNVITFCPHHNPRII